MQSRKLTILAGIGVLGVGLGILLSRNEIMTRYHLKRLRSEPAYFGKILSKPEGTNERVAIRVYLESNEGKRALMRECLLPGSIKKMVREKATHVVVCVEATQREIHLFNGSVVTEDPEDDMPADKSVYVFRSSPIERNMPDIRTMIQGFVPRWVHERVNAEWLPLAKEYLVDREYMCLQEYPGMQFAYSKALLPEARPRKQR